MLIQISASINLNPFQLFNFKTHGEACYVLQKFICLQSSPIFQN